MRREQIHLIDGGETMERMRIGLQMYTLREETANDFTGVLKKVAELGYEGVEFAGYGGLEPNQLADLLQELNLIGISSHVGIDRLIHALDEEIEMNVAIGSKYVICPYLGEEQRNSEQAITETLKVFIEASRRFAEHGIQFGYHNHDFEFTEKLNNNLLFDTISSGTTPEQLTIELDVCWVKYAGYDPVETIQQYAGRIPLIHLKDLRTLEDGRPLTVELGEGEVNLSAVIDAAGAANVGWMIVEQDVCQNPPLESVASSMKWLQNNYMNE